MNKKYIYTMYIYRKCDEIAQKGRLSYGYPMVIIWVSYGKGSSRSRVLAVFGCGRGAGGVWEGGERGVTAEREEMEECLRKIRKIRKIRTATLFRYEYLPQ